MTSATLILCKALQAKQFQACRTHANDPALCEGGEDGRAASLRLARHGLARADAVTSLLQHLATIPEAFELARSALPEGGGSEYGAVPLQACMKP